MPKHISLAERYDSFGNYGTLPSCHASQAFIHEAGPSRVANDSAPSPPQNLPSHHALGFQHTPNPTSAHGLATNQQPPFPPESQAQGSQRNLVRYTGLPSPPSSTGRPSPRRLSAQQTNVFLCGGCDKRYKHKSALARHNLESRKCRLGQGGRQFMCYWCIRPVATRRSTLKQHLMEFHRMEKQQAESNVNVWYNRYGAENEHPEAMLEIARMQWMMQ